MCLAIPVKVVEVKENSRANIDVAGKRQEISLQLLPEVRVGDYVLVNLGCAVAKLDEDEARKSLEIWQEIARLSQKRAKRGRS